MRTCINCGRVYPDAESEPGCNMCPACRSARDIGKYYGRELAKAVLNCFEIDVKQKEGVEFAVNATKLRELAKSILRGK